MHSKKKTTKSKDSRATPRTEIDYDMGTTKPARPRRQSRFVGARSRGRYI